VKNQSVALILALSLSGCQRPEIQELIVRVNKAVGFELIKFKPKTLPGEVQNEISQASDPDATPSAGDFAKANSELLAEMYKVVFHLEQVQDKSEFGGLTHSLNQGASLEGIYRGLVMGSRYRGLEGSTQSASPKVLKAFVGEMAELQATMRSPTEFQVESARQAPNIEFPDGAGAANDHPQVGKKQDTQEVTAKKDKTVLINELLQMFIGASNFTLKRVLADEALKKFDELKESPAELAQWYAGFVMRMCDSKVDFGLELRNKPDFDFHFKFAQRMAPDRVKWEVLNRYHRYLNFAIDHEN
jgi:hypothetical protein